MPFIQGSITNIGTRLQRGVSCFEFVTHNSPLFIKFQFAQLHILFPRHNPAPTLELTISILYSFRMKISIQSVTVKVRKYMAFWSFIK